MRESRKPFERSLLWIVLSICLIAMTPAWAATPAGADQAESRWWKGNLHTHTFWSDGDHFPEVVVRWYQEHGYHLTPESLIRAMNAGDFYCSTGVALKDIMFQNDTLTVHVAPEPDVTYAIRFIGTRRGYDPASSEVADAEGKTVRTTRRYSPEIGAVLVESQGTTASYTVKGDELYVRAKVVSSRKNEKSHVPDEYESAWVQPIVVK